MRAIYYPGTLELKEGERLRMAQADYDALPNYPLRSDYGERWKVERDGGRMVGEYVRGGIDYHEVEII